MIKGPKKLVNACTRVKEGENVLILTDRVTPLSIAEVLASACKERGAEPMGVIMSPSTKEHGGILPPPVAEAVMPRYFNFPSQAWGPAVISRREWMRSN